MTEIINYLILAIIGLVGLYVVFRVLSTAIFRSYFELKQSKEVKDGNLKEGSKKVDEEEVEGEV